jgi:DNA processing protein
MSLLSTTSGIHIIERHSYPETLKNMPSPPKKLYMRGTWPDTDTDATRRKYICIVGSRKQSLYGVSVLKSILSGLKGYPISIISGLAYGIDGSAHTTALDAGLHCIGFPGSSLEWNELYPREHLGLAQRIIESGGILLSEWPGGYPTGKWSFAARNRLMAGLAHATLIIEAGKKSGSLMTAKYAEEYGRDVFAIPGSIHDALSYGPHMLIQNGAALVTSAKDILRELGFEVKSDETSEMSKLIPDHIKNDPESMNIIKQVSQKQIMHEPAIIGELVDELGMPIEIINQKLSLLEIEGIIRIDGDTVRRV